MDIDRPAVATGNVSCPWYRVTVTVVTTVTAQIWREGTRDHRYGHLVAGIVRH